MKMQLDIAATTASSGTNGAVIDMAGWDGCLYVFNIGAMGSGATFDARVMTSANSNFSGNSNITNAAITQLANGSNTNTVMVDVWRPSSRYLKTVTTPATANVTFASIAIQYRGSGLFPLTQAAVQLVKVQVN
jgi:hypothetical protein